MKIALIGYGKMGKMIEQIALDRGHEIVSIIDIDNQQDFDSPEFASADVAIEFTAPQAAYGNYLKAWAKGVKVVSGSTGWLKDHGDDVRKACSEDGKTLFWASNFSIGVAIFSAVNRYLAKIMNQFPHTTWYECRNNVLVAKFSREFQSDVRASCCRYTTSLQNSLENF